MEGFYIYARQLDHLENDQDDGEEADEADATTSSAVPYRMLTILNGGGATTCTFSGLIKYTSYEFFMVPFYKTVDGKPSNTKQGRTLEDGELNSATRGRYLCYLERIGYTRPLQLIVNPVA